MTKRQVVALIPAHNEGASIGATVRSLRDQTRPPNRIIVVADNCTDNTVEEAMINGAEVFVTLGNTAKKAGALNQGLDYVIPSLESNDLVLTMDADSYLQFDWIERASGHLNLRMGAVSSSYVTENTSEFVPLLQKIEYAQQRRKIARKLGHVNVLAGVASLMFVSVLKQVASERGKTLPGNSGCYYHTNSLTEDFEITLAVKTLGYKPRAFKDCVAVTDVMPSWRDLAIQRIRWQRGTVETLWSYGITRVTRPLWASQMWLYGQTLLLPLVITLWAFAIYYGSVSITPVWLVILPILICEQIVSTAAAGKRAVWVAASIIPGMIYDNFRSIIYWTALIKAIFRQKSVWITN